ncbi:hypothetical protein BH10ACT3_BH10ACT3_13530 [soil metagenome]
MLTRNELEGWSHEERSALMRLLIELEVPAVEPTAEQRRLGVAVRTLVTAGAVLLVPWTVYLAMSLPHRTVTSQWRGAWVGFDLMLVVALALTAWLGWRGRQMVVIGLVSSAVLLICDAWFDVTLTSGEDKRISYLTALLVALPVAALFIRAARLISKASDRFVWNASGRLGPVPPLHRMPLVMRLRDDTVGLDERSD